MYMSLLWKLTYVHPTSLQSASGTPSLFQHLVSTRTNRLKEGEHRSTIFYMHFGQGANVCLIWSILCLPSRMVCQDAWDLGKSQYVLRVLLKFQDISQSVADLIVHASWFRETKERLLEVIFLFFDWYAGCVLFVAFHHLKVIHIDSQEVNSLSACQSLHTLFVLN